ncbi:MULTISPECIES: CotH kinase family protein [Anaerofustis]|uniref:CotH kinase family protein n=1 Tax=Anaerofustis TaxID=264995 RepID=UPI0011071455|nr:MULTISPECIES: CotH kinase family protein [Anaerofustis]MCO8192994.1 CotH kinase family protein [Anaerofustis sp. NSJ-163]
MIKSKKIDLICIIIIFVCVIFSFILISIKNLGIKSSTIQQPYVNKIFNDEKVHMIELHIKDWDKMITEVSEEYVPCNVKIDGEIFNNIGIRIKGNNSKQLIEKYGLTRYSLKLEFDHYNDSTNYYGLDKLNLDCSFQDNSYMKTYITFDMMKKMNIPTPLCSYTWVKVNGEDYGLFLAVEEPEEAFALRVFGKNHGQLYKPDYKDINDPNLDVALKYTTDEIDEYDNIFRNAKFQCSNRDKTRLINSLKNLSEKNNIDNYVDTNEVLRYFVVHNFTVNLDSYLGQTGHNYFLYEKNGKLSMIPWDYNLAYCTYSLGMPNPINDSTLYVNYPIDTPVSNEIAINRPMFYNLMTEEEYYNLYHLYFKEFIDIYFENNYYKVKIKETQNLIKDYVKKDPTAFCSYDDFNIAVKTFEDFCNLRAQSIKKQLKGEIPSTNYGQNKDKNNFIDASEIWIPNLGEINDLID